MVSVMLASAFPLVRCLAAFLVCSISASAEPQTFEEIKALAEQGDAGAQAMLGAMYYRGEGVSQDYEQALKWLTKAA